MTTPGSASSPRSSCEPPPGRSAWRSPPRWQSTVSPSEVLTDNGKQFTGRFGKPRPAEVLFERICRENGITQRLTRPRSPTTTGKIERLHQTLQLEPLNVHGPFTGIEDAQAAVDAWRKDYNAARPHQSL